MASRKRLTTRDNGPARIEVRAAQALRFEVFNLELNEGLSESFATG
jgi:hypothetical protein